jgi:hypothetical protein
VNGTNDFAYPLDSYQKSYRLVERIKPKLCVTVNMPHGHSQGWAPKEIGAFVDSVLKDGKPLVRLGTLARRDDNHVYASFEGSAKLKKAELHYTTDTGRWQGRKWRTLPATIDDENNQIQAEIPTARPLVAFLTMIDDRGYTVSTDHVVLQTNPKRE